MKNLYKRKRPRRDFHHSGVDVLRMSPEQFSQFQGVANHFLGNKVFHEAIPSHPRKKILPSSFQTIVDVDSPSTLAALMHLEKTAHDDHTLESHMGGGLYEAGNSILNGLWNTVGWGPEYASWFGHYNYDSPENRPTTQDQQYAAIVQQSYKPVGERDDSMFDGDWVRDQDLDDSLFSVWVDEGDKEVHVALRGTKMNYDDLAADWSIIVSNSSGKVDEIREYLEKVVDKYDGYELDVSGHSLGGNELIEAFEGGEGLEGYGRVNLFNPGYTPTHNLDEAKEAVADDRMHFYLNSGDLLSNTFVSLVPSERDNVTWAKPGHSPLGNHGLAQWNPDDLKSS